VFKCANLCCALKSVNSSFLLVPRVEISPILDSSDKRVYEEVKVVIMCCMLSGVTGMGCCSAKEHEEQECRLVSLVLLLSKMFVVIMSQRLVPTLKAPKRSWKIQFLSSLATIGGTTTLGSQNCLS
jgi:hypothetical protein